MALRHRWTAGRVDWALLALAGWLAMGVSAAGGQAVAADMVVKPGDGFDGATPAPEAVGDGEWADAMAIARWDAVPYQRFDGQLRVGVVAFHVGGIDRVEFSADGGEWLAVGRPTLNPRTGVEEYWVTVRAHDFDDGAVELRAVAYPKVGVPRVLQGPLLENGAAANGTHGLILYANSGGSLHPQTLYVSPRGSDSAAGTREAPLTLEKAMETISDGGRIVLLGPGRYDFGKPSKHAGPGLNNQRWVTVEAEDPADRDTIIIGQSDGGAVRPGIGKMRWRHVSFDNAACSQYYNSGLAWFDNVRWFDAEGWASGEKRLSPIRGIYYATDSLAEGKTYGFTNATLARNVTLREISGDALQNSKLVLNATLENIDGTVTGHHTDAYQMWGEAENLIVYGVEARGLKSVQSLFLEPTWRSGADEPLLTLSNAAFVNLVFDNDVKPRGDQANWGGPPYSQVFPALNHVLFRGIELPNQRLMLRGQGPHAFQAEDVLFDDVLLHWSTWESYYGPKAKPVEGVTFRDGHTRESATAAVSNTGDPATPLTRVRR